jgi:hypothetical protein
MANKATALERLGRLDEQRLVIATALSYNVGLTLLRAAPSGISANCLAFRKAYSPTG